jgi:hypothetical protein
MIDPVAAHGGAKPKPLPGRQTPAMPRLTGSSPILADSDGDGFDDRVEVVAGMDPNDPFSFPASVPPFGPWRIAGLIALLVSLGTGRLRFTAGWRELRRSHWGGVVLSS